MAIHGVLIPQAIAAANIDAWNRSAISASALDNGNIVALATRSATANESEVFVATQPTASASTLTGAWMVYASDEIVLTDSRYKGIDPDVRNFFTAASKVVSVYKPAVGDIIMVTTDALGGSYSVGVTTHINATNATYQLTWGNSQTASVLSYKLLAVKYISLATGAIDTQRVASYQFECVAI